MMMKTIHLLLRGAAADKAEAVRDAHAAAILRQQIRDAASALGVARRELAVAMAYRTAEERAIVTLGERIEMLSASARQAIADGRDDFGREAAALIAALEDERIDRREAQAGFAREVERLTTLVGEGDGRLRDLDRGLKGARAAEAVRRAGINGRRVASVSGGALDEAEQTLKRWRERQRTEEDVADALETLAASDPSRIESRLAAQGYGRPRTDPKAVFESLKAAASTH